jgi:hypothetical protein
VLLAVSPLQELVQLPRAASPFLQQPMHHDWFEGDQWSEESSQLNVPAGLAEAFVETAVQSTFLMPSSASSSDFPQVVFSKGFTVPFQNAKLF